MDLRRVVPDEKHRQSGESLSLRILVMYDAKASESLESNRGESRPRQGNSSRLCCLLDSRPDSLAELLTGDGQSFYRVRAPSLWLVLYHQSSTNKKAPRGAGCFI